MRWKAIYLILGLLIFLGLFGFFFLDSLLGWIISYSLETTIGAKTEVNQLHLDIPKLRMTIGDLQITNPKDTWRNLIQTKNIRFQMAAEPLYSGKIVIDEVSIEDLMINTPRKTNGKINKIILPGPFGQAQKKLNNDISTLPALDPQSISLKVPTDKLLASYQLKTKLATVETRERIEKSNQKWQTNLQKLSQIKLKIQELQNKVQEYQAAKTDNLLQIRNKLQGLQDIQKSSGAIQQELGTNTNGLQTEFTTLRASIGNLKNAADTDYHDLLKLAKLPDFNSVNIAEVLFGKALLNESSSMLDIVDKVQKQIPVRMDNPPKEAHPRGGQDIIFPGRRTYPNFLIKHVSISAQGTGNTAFEGFSAQGMAEGITDQPQIFGAPMLVKMAAQARNHSYINFDGSLNHITPAIDDRLNLTIGNLGIPKFQLADSPYLPNKLSSGIVNLVTEMRIQSDRFTLNVNLQCHNLVSDYSSKPASNDLVTQVVRDSLSKVDQISIRYQLEGINKKLNMKLSSDIDQIVSARLKAVVGARIEQETQGIRQQVNAELQKDQQELTTLCNKYQNDLTTSISQVQSQLDKEQQKIEQTKKELAKKATPQLPQLPKLPQIKLK